MPIRNLEERRAYQREWIARRRAEWFADKACRECGATEDLHIHHRDPEQKVTHAVWSWREDRRLAELAKCDVLCFSCHHELHDAPRRRHGSRRRYEKGCRCDACRARKAEIMAAYHARKRARKDSNLRRPASEARGLSPQASA